MNSRHIITKNIAYHKKLMQIGALLFFISAIGLFFLPFSTPVFLSIIIFLAFTIFLLYQSKKQSNPFFDCLVSHPKSVVWVYRHRLISMPFGIKTFERNTLYIYTFDKKRHSLVIRAKDIEQLLKCLQNELSHATFGYSIQKEQLYRANPRLLLR